jgi:hypothetical protein
MTNISIIGTEHSGKTVFITVFAEKHPEHLAFDDPKTKNYVTDKWTTLLRGEWPSSTEDKLELHWHLSVRGKPHPVSVLDTSGQDIRTIYENPEQLESEIKEGRTELSRLRDHINKADILLILLDITEAIEAENLPGPEKEEKIKDIEIPAAMIIKAAFERGQSVAILLSKYDQVKPYLERNGIDPSKPIGAIRKLLKGVASRIEQSGGSKKIKILPIAAVSETIEKEVENGDGVKVKMRFPKVVGKDEDAIASTGIDETLEWISKTVGRAAFCNRIKARLRNFFTSEKNGVIPSVCRGIAGAFIGGFFGFLTGDFRFYYMFACLFAFCACFLGAHKKNNAAGTKLKTRLLKVSVFSLLLLFGGICVWKDYYESEIAKKKEGIVEETATINRIKQEVNKEYGTGKNKVEGTAKTDRNEIIADSDKELHRIAEQLKQEENRINAIFSLENKDEIQKYEQKEANEIRLHCKTERDRVSAWEKEAKQKVREEKKTIEVEEKKEIPKSDYKVDIDISRLRKEDTLSFRNISGKQFHNATLDVFFGDKKETFVITVEYLGSGDMPQEFKHNFENKAISHTAYAYFKVKQTADLSPEEISAKEERIEREKNKRLREIAEREERDIGVLKNRILKQITELHEGNAEHKQKRIEQLRIAHSRAEQERKLIQERQSKQLINVQNKTEAKLKELKVKFDNDILSLDKQLPVLSTANSALKCAGIIVLFLVILNVFLFLTTSWLAKALTPEKSEE